MMKIAAALLGTAGLCVSLTAGVTPVLPAPASIHISDTLSVKIAQAVVDVTCQRCHNADRMRGNMSLDDFSVESVEDNAARGDNEMIRYLVEQGADVMLVARSGQTTVDMANGPVQRVELFPETIALLESLGARNNHRCVSC